MNNVHENPPLRRNQSAQQLSSNVVNPSVSIGSHFYRVPEIRVGTASASSSHQPLSQQNRSRRPPPLDLSFLSNTVDDAYLNSRVLSQDRVRIHVNTNAQFNPFIALSPSSPVRVSELFWIE